MKISHKILLVLLGLSLNSCWDDFSCDKWTNAVKNEYNFKLILSEKVNHGTRDIYLYGIDLTNHKEAIFHEGGGWLSRDFDKFQIGDTLIKEKGKYTLVIKRNGKVILVPLECGGITYTDKK